MTTIQPDPAWICMPLEKGPLYVLTNQGCEDTGYWSPAWFKSLGLDYGEWNGEPYPLTDQEASLISEDCAQTPAEGILLFGYTAVYQGQKWLMPTIEYMKPVKKRSMTRERHILENLVAPHKGMVVIEPEGPEDRITVCILIPLPAAIEAFGSFNVVKRYLERGLGIPEKE